MNRLCKTKNQMVKKAMNNFQISSKKKVKSKIETRKKFLLTT